ncbi:MAG: DNA polymerase III subunit delta' [Deltaproteobacteria bacterium]|nr:DNA polymerase III subunit delta' [Deltaproteobacteria bacterium]
MSFTDIPGQERVVRTIKNALEAGRLPHALLFQGPMGVGKKDTAIELAKALNCAAQTGDACGSCIQCRKIERRVHPDVRLIERETEKTKISISQIRELIRTMTQFKPFEGRAKVLILDRAEELSQEGENALLKTLEEPPRDTYLILVTSEPNRLLPTTRSRCQKIVFTRAPYPIVYKKALELTANDEEYAKLLALLADGSIGSLEELHKQNLKERWPAMEDAAGGDIDPVYALLLASREGRSRESAIRCLKLLDAALRKRLLEAAENLAAWEVEDVLESLDLLSTYRRNIDLGINPRLLMENVFLALSHKGRVHVS